jgi:hypothetical protein
VKLDHYHTVMVQLQQEGGQGSPTPPPNRIATTTIKTNAAKTPATTTATDFHSALMVALT